MEKVPKQVYTKEFREQAANWVHFARSGKLIEMGEKRKPVTDWEAENSRLRRELAEAKMEPDLLKKATAQPPPPLPPYTAKPALNRRVIHTQWRGNGWGAPRNI